MMASTKTKNTMEWIMQYIRLFLASLVVIAISLINSSCGGGDSDGDNTDIGGDEAVEVIIREDNPNIPVDHEGTVEGNARYYSVPTEGYKAAVTVTGLTNLIEVRLEDEILLVSTNDNPVIFNRTYLPNTVVNLSIEKQPFLQECLTTSGSSGTISPDSTLNFSISCTDSSVPSYPEFSYIYSINTESINLEWGDSEDRDSTASSIAYRIYYSTLQSNVQNRIAPSVTTAQGVLQASLTALSADTSYYLAIEAFDPEGNTSELSDIRELRTLALPNQLTGIPYYVIDSQNITIADDTWTIVLTEFTGVPQVGDTLIRDTGSNTEVKKILSVTTNSANYEFQIEAGDISDIFQRVTLSSEISLTEEDFLSTSPRLANRSANKFIDKLQFTLGACRSTDTTLTADQLNQFSWYWVTTEKPKVKNNIQYSLADGVTGSLDFSGTLKVGTGVNWTVLDGISGEFTCDIVGLPLTRIIPPTPNFPLYTRVEFDTQLKLTFSGENELTADAKMYAYRDVSARLVHNSTTDEWEFDQSVSEAKLGLDGELEFATRMNSKLALLPKISTTFYETASVSLTADVGTSFNFEGLLIDVDDPLYKFRDRPFILNELKADADVALLLNADLSIGPFTFYELPEYELYRSDPLTFFDTPEVCTNDSTNKESCEKLKRVSPNSETNTIDLEFYTIDGVLNPFDLDTVKWQVHPDNGYIEVKKDEDPRKATAHVYDEGSYTVVASGHGLLPGARKYAQFLIGNSCQFGLGEEIPPEAEKYIYLDSGFVLPDNISFLNEGSGYVETCQFTDEPYIHNTLNNSQIQTINERLCTYYSGYKHGPCIVTSSVHETSTIDGSLIREEVTTSEFQYDHGFPVSLVETNTVGDNKFTKKWKYKKIPIPGSNWSSSFPIYYEYWKGIIGDKFLYKIDIDPESRLMKTNVYYESGIKRAEWLIGNISIDLPPPPDEPDGINIFVSSHPFVYVHALIGDDGDTIYSKSWFPNGKLQDHSEFDENGRTVFIQCLYYNDQDVPVQFNDRLPEHEHRCIDRLN